MEDNNVQDRILHLMEFKNISGKQDKNSISKGKIEYQKKAADGINYAIIQEGNRFYLKKEINENFEYINGIRNKEKFSYQSIGTAKIELALKIKKINESLGAENAFDILNPENKDNSILNEGKVIRNELERNKQLMESVEEFANKNTTSPDDDFEETIEVETVGNDSDPNTTDNTMSPYIEEVKPVDMERDIEVDKKVDVETAYKEKPKHISFSPKQIEMIKGTSAQKPCECEKKDEPKEEPKKEDEKVNEEPKEESKDESKDKKEEGLEINESLLRKITEMVAEKLALKKK